MLYKYYPQGRFFDNGMVRFTQPSALNDPEDCLPQIQIEEFSAEDYSVAEAQATADGWHSADKDDLVDFYLRPYPSGRMNEQHFPGLWPAKEPRLRPEPFETLDELDKAIAERAVVLCIQEADRQIGILSLSRSTKEHMWAYYAAGHSGLRIGFDESHPFFYGQGFDVAYLDNRIKASLNNGWVRIGGILWRTEDILSGTLGDVPLELFFRKAPEWQNELEFRMIKRLSEADLIVNPTAEFPVCLFSIPSEAVVDVTFGYKAADDLRKDVSSQIRSSRALDHVKIKARERSNTGSIVERLIS